MNHIQVGAHIPISHGSKREWAQGIWVFQIGFNIPPKTMIASIIHSIQQKLIYWRLKKLSLAGCIIMVNHVFLVAIWYNLLCWMISKWSIHQIQRLVCNLWCEDFNQEMNAGKCYHDYASLTLVQEKGPTAPPQTGWILNMNLKPSFSRQLDLEDRFSASMWNGLVWH